MNQSLVEEKISNIESGSDFVDTVFDYWNPLEVLSVENEISKFIFQMIGFSFNCFEVQKQFLYLCFYYVNRYDMLIETSRMSNLNKLANSMKAHEVATLIFVKSKIPNFVPIQK